MFKGTYPFMHREEKIADIEFRKNYFFRIKKIYQEERFPLFLSKEKDLDRDYQLSLFFKERGPSLQNPNYPYLSLLEWNRYLSFFDDYWVCIDDKPFKELRRYNFDEDPVIYIDLSRMEPKQVKYSPNLSLNQMYFDIDDKSHTRYLLLPYEKKKKQLYDLIKKPYEVQIKNATPFIRIALPKGELFHFSSICQKQVTKEEQLEYLKKIPLPYHCLEGMKFDYEIFLDRLYLVKNEKDITLEFI